MSATLSHPARGVVFIHSAPVALCLHIEWAIQRVTGQRPIIDWTSQPAAPGLQRMELSWTGPVGTAAALASAFRGWDNVRFEITEEATSGCEGSRYLHTPRLGIHHVRMTAAGESLLTEGQLREIIMLAQGSAEAMTEMIEELLGADVDAELEPFRHAAEGAPVRWLHKVG